MAAVDRRVNAAHRLARTIGIIKWAVLLIAAFAVVAALSSGNKYVSAALVLPMAMVGLVAFVTFGWFQHTLRMLATIAGNTTQRSRGLPW